jgi:amino acid transporter
MIPSLTSWQVIAAAILFIWLSFTLHSMRIRDIGWDPVCVIPGWIVVAIIDGLVASKIPAIALGGQHGTIVGALVNLALFLALLFWPSSEHDDSATPSGGSFRMPDLPSRSPAAATSRVARVANGEFGRRAV